MKRLQHTTSTHQKLIWFRPFGAITWLGWAVRPAIVTVGPAIVTVAAVKPWCNWYPICQYSPCQLYLNVDFRQINRYYDRHLI